MTRLEGFAVAPPGLEGVLKDELSTLKVRALQLTVGGVAFRGDWREVYGINLNSRVAGRVLVRVARLAAHSFKELARGLSRIEWESWLDPGAGATISISTRKTRLYHTGKLEEIFREATGLAVGEGASLFMRISGDKCLISLDTSGEHLHRRGYRSLAGEAPLRENIAAGLLIAAGYDGCETLLDPCCGSGTFGIEGAMISLGLAPGLGRAFAFEALPSFDVEGWATLKERAINGAHGTPLAPIILNDISPDAIALARAGAASAGVGELLEISVGDMEALKPPSEGGLLVANPPYGVRLGRAGEVYGKIAHLLAGSFKGWRWGVIELRRGKGKRLSGAAECIDFTSGGLALAFNMGGMP
ncbi:MAG: RNA methyltransferase [Deltaproteobacteria bacterium]|nr:MAG: RNA methyltransferase [Deltaproteobacteria bacterium]